MNKMKLKLMSAKVFLVCACGGRTSGEWTPKMRTNCCFLWTVLLLTSAASTALAASATVYNLGTLGGSESYGYAINASGQVAGYSNTSGNEQRAFLYTGTPGVDGHMADLGTLPIFDLGPGSRAYGINASGQVVGDCDNLENYISRAFFYTGTPESGGAMAYLGNLFPDQPASLADSHGRGINANGQVAGYSQAAPNGSYHAFLVSGGAMADLGTLAGPNGSSVASGINASGQVVGLSSLTGDMAYHAFRYDGTPGSGGAMADLGTLPGKTHSQGLAINDVGQVVGNSWSDFTTQHAFLYTGTPGSGGAMADLGTLGGTYSAAQAINTSGQVAGESKTTGGAQHAFLYTGTPGVDGHMIDLDLWLNANNPSEGAKWTLISAAGVNDSGLITGSGTYNDGPGGLTDGACAFLLDASAFVNASLPGDYNSNGTVGPEDYNLWKSSFGSTSNLAADGNGNHVIDTADYSIWRDHLGATLGSGSGLALPSAKPLSAGVPEPATVGLLIVGILAMVSLRRASVS